MTEFKRVATDEDFFNLWSRITTKVAYNIQDKLPKFLTEVSDKKVVSKQIMTFEQDQYEKGKHFAGMERGRDLYERSSKPWHLSQTDLPSEPITWVLYNNDPSESSSVQFNQPGNYCLKFNHLSWKDYLKFNKKNAVVDADGRLCRKWNMSVGDRHLSVHYLADSSRSTIHPIVLNITRKVLATKRGTVRLFWASQIGEKEIPGAAENHYSRHTKDVFENAGSGCVMDEDQKVTLQLEGHVTCEISRLPDTMPVDLPTFAKC